MTAHEMEPVRLAMVGLGWWGAKMTALLGEMDEAEVVRAVDPDPAARARATAAGIEATAALEDALVDPRVEAVVLATPHAVHRAQIEAAVGAGKHVFCEKPLGLARADAERAVALCRDAGLALGIGHERRYEPPVAEMLARADAGRFGRLQQFEAVFSHDRFLALDPSNWRIDASHAPGAGMTATGVHLLDLATRLMGRARDVRVSCETLSSSLPQGDTISAHVRFERGGTAYVSASLATPFVSRMALYGSEGWMEIRDKAHLEAPEGWLVIESAKGGPIVLREIPPSDAVRDNLAAFARAVRGQAPYPITGEEMIANTALLEAVFKSAVSGAIEAVW